jgi:chromosome segregation ATPase
MTKDQLQQELNEKVKEGIKPSHLKKLKRSKSADDIPAAPSAPTTKIKELADKVRVLELEIEVKDRELIETKQELDNSLLARHEAVKQFGKVYDKLQQIRKELDETVEEASTELNSSDNQVSQLRTKLRTASQQLNQLQQELRLEKDKSNRFSFVENQKEKKGTIPSNSAELPTGLNYLKLALYALLTI